MNDRSAAKREGVLQLDDGRLLAYTDWGELDAYPVIYCHGFPGCRRELDAMIPLLARRGVDVRLVALNRPGYGGSTFQSNRRFVDWPGDVAHAVDRLDIGRFAVLGVSGGAPYALACGHLLAERVSRVGLAVGIAPIGATGMEDATAISGPSSIGSVRRLQFGMAAVAFRQGHGDQFIEKSIASLGPTDRDAMTRPAVRDWFAGVMEEAFAQGGRGIAQEAGLFRQSWGFDPNEVVVDTSLWYGGADETVPASAGEWLHARLPNSSYALWPEQGHFSWMFGDEAVEVVGSIVQPEATQPADG